MADSEIVLIDFIVERLHSFLKLGFRGVGRKHRALKGLGLVISQELWVFWTYG